MAEGNLRLGRTVVADSVNPIDLTRSAWLAAAERAGCSGIEVEVTCSDPVEHRKRIETRQPDISSHRLPSWQDTLDRSDEPWTRERIVIDTAGRSVRECVRELSVKLLPLLPPETN